MEDIGRPRRSRLPLSDGGPVRDPRGDAATHASHLAQGTREIAKLRIDDLGPALPASDITTIVAALKRPITDVMLETCLLEATSTSPEMHRVLGRISRNMDRIERIAAELGDIAAIMQDRLILCRRSNELHALLGEVIERAIAPRDRARILVEGPPAVLAFVDAPRIEHVLLTLLQNALHATPNGNPVVIRIEALSEITRVSVIDAGRSRADASAFEPSEDGIAMYVCRRIIEAHGGCVGVERRIGTGSHFYFELPVTTTPRLHALIVEDDHRQLEALAELLRQSDIAVTMADCGSAALVGAIDHHVDIAILDVEMLDVASTEIVEQLRYRSPKLPIIVVSGYPPDSERVRAVLDACQGTFIAKPIDIDVLLAEIARCTTNVVS